MAGNRPTFWKRLSRDLRFVRGLRRTLKRVKSIRADSPDLLCDDLEAAVDRFPEREALVFEGRTLTYAQMDALANRYANWARGRGIARGAVVAVFLPNRIEYIPIWYGLSKVGVVSALINNQLSGAGLAHCIDIAKASHLICDAETAVAFEEVRGRLAKPVTEWVVGGGVATGAVRADRDLDRSLKGVSALRPTRETARAGLTAGDTALYIYTSGTTGLPKAARITHVRAQLYMRGMAAATEAKAEDRVLVPLPLYHSTGGLCAVGAALLNGGLLLIRRRFSASQFWEEATADGATVLVYIGELCRYLVNQPETAAEHGHHLRLAFGNGLRADVWREMVERFRIPRVLEFYGATEGNVSLINLDGKVGAVGRIPRWLRKRFNVRLAAHDVETGEVLRDGRGLVLAPRPGEPGEVLGRIDASDPRASYTGYSDRAASERKVLHDVAQKGDAWFRTGDLMREDGEGYFYFVDRVGDTFRWKGENVATGEVEAALARAPGVEEANVYGVEVPGQEGRAGMAALVVAQGFDLAELDAVIDRELPPYAQPRFLRLQPSLETTGTFKHRKADLVAEGFDPEKVGGRLYVREVGAGSRPLEHQAFARIAAGELRL
ncbi:MAG: long-chain-acyl-CoA synthetase [Caulobacteraceae bacterium]|nr:long-chain-acyl-CoA synthetase [Caulobacter sp.]